MKPDMLAAIEPDRWNVLFHEKAKSRVLSWMAFGRFKHVSAFAYYAGFKCWLLYDARWSGLSLTLIEDESFKTIIRDYTENCTWVVFERTRAPLPIYARLGLYCVPAIKHLLSLRSCALRPDALYAHLMRHGGTVIPDGRRPGTTPAAD